MTMPCDWPVDDGCLPTVESGDDQAAVTLDDSIEIAQSVLWALSGRRYGVCEESVRPCPPRAGWWESRYEVYSLEDKRWAIGCGCGSGGCCSSGPGMVHLPGPAVDIVEVLIAGEPLTPDQYVLEGDVLYRTGDSKVWPFQNLSRPAGEPGTWTVTYMRGVPVPNGVGRFVSALATEFFNACTGGKCRLPRTVTELTRQGVSHRIYNPQDIYNSGKTGIPEIDMWLSSVNPHGLMQGPEVL